MKYIIYNLFLFCSLFSISNAQEYFWSELNGPFGGIINSIEINSSGDIFVSTGNPGSNGGGSGRNGVFRSTDNGQNWQHLNISLSYGREINCLEISENDDIYAGSYFGGVYKSTDNGETWETANGALLGGQVIDALTSLQGNIIIAGARNGKVYRSTDGGNAWVIVLDQGASSTALTVGPGQKVYFGSLSYVYYSEDMGQNWQEISYFDFKGAASFAFIDNNKIFVASRSNGIFRSTDNGQSWFSYNEGLPSSFQAREINVRNNYYIFLATDKYGIYRAEDPNQNWESVNSGLSRKDILSVNFPDSGPIYAGTDGGFFSSSDLGTTWAESDNGLLNSIVKTIVINKDLNILFVGTSGGVLKSSDSGLSWIRINNGINQFDDIITLAITTNGTLFAGTQQSGIYRSIDNENWSYINNPLMQNASINTILVDLMGNIFVGTGNSIGMLKSTDNGDNWMQINNGLSDLRINASAINLMGTIFIGTDTSGIFYSNDSGELWHKIQIPEWGNSEISILKITEDDKIYAGVQTGNTELYISSDNGNSWDIIQGQFNYRIDALEIANIYGFLGSYQGIQRFSIENNNWTLIPDIINPLLSNRKVLSLFKGNDGYIYAGSDAAGVFKSSSPVNSVKNEHRYLDDFLCYQNYPNPFNPTTNIKYEIPKTSFVSIKVFDVLGREISTLVNEEKTQGSYEISFDASELTSGIYFYRIQAGTYVESKKMMFLK